MMWVWLSISPGRTRALEVDDLCLRPGERHDLLVGADRGKRPVLDGDCGGIRIGAVERREQSVVRIRSGAGMDAMFYCASVWLVV